LFLLTARRVLHCADSSLVLNAIPYGPPGSDSAATVLVCQVSVPELIYGVKAGEIAAILNRRQHQSCEAQLTVKAGEEKAREALDELLPDYFACGVRGLLAV